MPNFSMKSFIRVFMLVALVVGPVWAQRSTSIGDVVVGVDKNTVLIRVSANTPELNSLAQLAFSAHGRYKLVASGQAYDIKFTAVGAKQVGVEITKGAANTAVASEVVTGTSQRNALLRAADVAVVKTNGVGLKGFFASKVAFIRDQGRAKEVCVADLFFGEAKQITHDNALALMPRWAPDGNKIIYTSFYKSGYPDIFLLDVASGRHETFVSFRGTNQGARFSPNGQQVAMVLSGEGTSEIYLSNAQGRQVSRKTRSDAVKSSPCFSPDGGRVVFTMEPGPQLYVMSTAGGSPQRLVTGFRYAAEPDWSRANPQKIACTVRVEGGKYQIAVYDFALGKAEVVSKAAFDGIEASWLPDGRHLVYTARDRTSSVLSILDTETGNSRRISASNLGPVAQASVLAQ
jgi:TolB protein